MCNFKKIDNSVHLYHTYQIYIRFILDLYYIGDYVKN